MSLMSLRESLARSQAKWKQRLHLSSSNANSPRSSTADLASVPSDGLPGTAGFAEPTGHVSTGSIPVQLRERTTKTETAVANSPGKKGAAWPVVRSLLTTLESSADAFGPLKSVISALNTCAGIFETVSSGRTEYEQLRGKIEGILADLAKHTAPPMELVMTDSVKRLCADIEVELRKVEEVQTRDTGRRLLDAAMESNEILECYCRIQGHLERLTLNANMDILKAINKQAMETQLASIMPSKAAVYNSAESDEIKRGNCTPGTREQQIDMLLKWARDQETGRTCWVNGMAGTGKTTIAYTVCSKLEEGFELGASFFCSRSIPECRQVKHIIPSIAYQLARFSLPFRCALVKALELDPDAPTRALKIQYQKLIIDPLLAVQQSLPTDFIVVVDALDECDNSDSVGQILGLLVSTPSSFPIRFLVSSRPEPDISLLMGQADTQGDTRLVLHDLNVDAVKADIEVYMKYELGQVPLTENQRATLVERCGVLFIYASTTCRYIQHAYKMDNLDEAMNTISGFGSVASDRGGENAIDELYLTILSAAFERPRLSRIDKSNMKKVLETVVCAAEPMSLDALVDLLGLKSKKQLDALLLPFRSVLNVKEPGGLVTTLHASFPDFMLSEDRSAGFHCEPGMRNADIAKACLSIIDQIEPKFNICSIPSSHLLDNEIEDLDDRVRRSISLGLVYACRYWSTHLSLGEYQDGIVDLVHRFLSSRLLIWMEVLNLTKQMRSGIGIMQEVEKWCLKPEHLATSDMAHLAHDAWQFVSMFANHPVSKSTPHIYMSMLPFWPVSRPISQAYMPRTAGVVQPTGTAATRRKLALLATWDVAPPQTENYSMSLSVDGTRLAANTEHGIVVLDTITGESIYNLSGTDDVFSVAISPNGTEVTFGCHSGVIKHWDPRKGVTELLPSQEFDSDITSLIFSSDQGRVAIGLKSGDIYICLLRCTGRVRGPLKGHTDSVSSIAFSPDGLHLASGSDDETVRIWDAITGHMVGNTLEGHTDMVNSVSYSFDGSHLTSASDDGTIRVWDPKTGQTVLEPLEGHSDWVNSVAFSPSGRFIASASDDETILVYDAQTGQKVFGPLRGHTDSVYSVMFSPDNSRLFSRSDDGTIRAWNVQDPDTPDPTLSSSSLSSPIISIRYSHSGSQVVSGSDDGTIHIWDVQTGNMVLGPLHGHTFYIFSVDWSPNDAYIASASLDYTLRIWDASNGSDIHGSIEGHTEVVNCVRFSPDSSFLASGSDDGTVRIWDVTSGQQVMTLLDGDDPIHSIGFSPDGGHLLSGSENGTLQVLDRQTGGAVIGPLQAHSGRISAVEFSPDGLQILSSSFDKTIHIWDIQPKQQSLIPHEHPLKHNDGVNSASFSPDGRFIVSGCNDFTVQLWDAKTGKSILDPLEGHTSLVLCVQFSPDGSHVVSCSDDRTIRFWDVSKCKDQPQESLNQDERNAEAPSPSIGIGNTPGAWSLDWDGWVVDRQKRRLVWVPSDLQNCPRLMPWSDTVITDKPLLKLEFDGVLMGEGWTGCYRP